MSMQPSWLPLLVQSEDHGGGWQRYIDAVYAVFNRDFIASQPKFNGLWVRCRRDLLDGKEAAFWHCTSEGPNETNRTPDFRRCERIGWVRAIIDHVDDPKVDVWQKHKKRDQRCYLWFDEIYLVVLGHRRKHYQLITAFCTDREHARRRLRRERDEGLNV